MHVIGTAGHVDHGKSTLVQALTGIDPDRLAEEKSREMTIDLGFAWLTLNGEEVGVVDVPGHRDFIENMLAGVGGINLALFIIAADEGVMPQTREHLAILDLLKINRGVVALTKCDLIDDADWLELVTLEVADVLESTTLAGSPIIPVSARTGAGIADLKTALGNRLAEIDPPGDWGKARLPIDRVFSLPGFGTVVTGTLLDGSLRVGDEVHIQPGNLAGRIRGLQTHKTKRDIAHPGSRVAVNLTGVGREDLARGQVVALPPVLHETKLIDAQYRHLAGAAAPLSHNTEVKLFVGSAEVTARARLIGQDKIEAGTGGWIQLALSAPVAVIRGDRYILRRPSPGETIGGGIILDSHPGRRHRRFREDVTSRFQALSQGTPDDLILNTLSRLGPTPSKNLIDRAGLPKEEAEAAIRMLITDGRIIDLGKVLLTPPAWNALRNRLLEILENYHRNAPLRAGMEREAVRSKLQTTPAVFNVMVDEFKAANLLVENGTLLKLPGHEIMFSTEEEAAIAQLMDQFKRQGILSPSVKECKAVVGDGIYYALVDLGRLKSISEDVVYTAELYDQLLNQLTSHLHQTGSISAPEARDLLGASRKYAIALLEHMDELRITRRSGDIRLPARPIKE
jgi:selenocysteine-specific elongation factor